ncbi:MAG: hypothetical protein GY796_15740 [Chloroflexi bacterium]|nr:hypothetical protein [Chloroflexota bacterium]
MILKMVMQMRVPEIIDQHYEAHGNHQGLSVGWLAALFVVYMLAESNHKMVTVREWVRKHQTTLEKQTGQRIRPTDFTDDRLGDVLRYLSEDELWGQIEQDLSQHTIRVYKLETNQPIRLDATVGGSKHDEQKHSLFKTGRNKDGVFEVQFKLMLGVLDPLGLALAADVVSGEGGDDPLYVPIYQRIRQTLGQAGRLYIGDSKMGALNTRAVIADGGDYYLTPLALVGQTPALLEELLSVVEAGQINLTKIYLPEDLPTDPDQAPDPELALAEGFEVVREQQARLEDGSLVTWQERVLVVRSYAFAQAQIKNFEQRLAQAEAEILGLTPSRGPGKRQFDDPVALHQAIEAIVKRYRVSACFDIELERQATLRQVRAYKDRPARTEEQVRYQVHLTRREKAIEQAKFRLGWRLYATNAPVQQFSLTEAVLAYRDQYLVERNFAQIKGPLLAMLPLYVQRDDHALGLIRLLTVALRLLTIIEFVVRRSLSTAEQTITGLYDGNPKRQTATPSVALLLNVFDNISLTTITQANQITGQHLTPLTAVQRRILDLLDLSPHIYESLVDFSTSSSITQGGVRPINGLPC